MFCRFHRNTINSYKEFYNTFFLYTINNKIYDPIDFDVKINLIFDKIQKKKKNTLSFLLFDIFYP